jgi:hypothetical protein
VLEQIENEREHMVESYTIWHNENRWPTHGHYRVRHAFVEVLRRYWERWMDAPLPKGKNDGPAARFVFHALNPFLMFAKQQYDLELHRKLPLTDHTQVTDMINAHHNSRSRKK